jgi:hypothetical protein
MKSETETIAGYTFGTDEVPRSPVSLAELERLRQTVKTVAFP